MGSFVLKKPYKCFTECQFGGCPGHEAKLQFNSVADTYTYSNGRGQEINFDVTERDLLIELLKEGKDI